MQLQCPNSRCRTAIAFGQRLGSNLRCSRCGCPSIPPRLFISYRRADAAEEVYAIPTVVSYLEETFGPDCVFVDQRIPTGAHFPTVVRSEITESDFLVCIVGRCWVSECEGSLHEDDDWIRQELELARETGKHVFPVLVAGAKMPPRAKMPATLRWFADLNAARVRGGMDFQNDIRSVMDDVARAPLNASLRFAVMGSHGADPRRVVILTTNRRDFTIGRSETADTNVSSAGVSRLHARIVPRDGAFWLQDAGSANGTFLNEKQVIGGLERLREGDQITAAGVAFVFDRADRLLETAAGEEKGEPHIGSRKTLVGSANLKTEQFNVWDLVEGAPDGEVGKHGFVFVGCSETCEVQQLLPMLIMLTKEARIWLPRPGSSRTEVDRRMEAASSIIALLSSHASTQQVAERCSHAASKYSTPLLILSVVESGAIPSVPLAFLGAPTFYVRALPPVDLVKRLVDHLPREVLRANRA